MRRLIGLLYAVAILMKSSLSKRYSMCVCGHSHGYHYVKMPQMCSWNTGLAESCRCEGFSKAEVPCV